MRLDRGFLLICPNVPFVEHHPTPAHSGLALNRPIGSKTAEILKRRGVILRKPQVMMQESSKLPRGRKRCDATSTKDKAAGFT